MSDLGWGAKLPAEAEQREFQVPPVGEYNFMVVSVEKTYSSAGNSMAKVRLDLQGADGSVFDNLVLTDNMIWKLNSFFESIGIKEKGKELDIDLSTAFDKAQGKEGRLKVKHETYNGKPSAKVDRYIIPTAKKAPTAPAAPAADDNFSLPFPVDEEK